MDFLRPEDLGIAFCTRATAEHSYAAAHKRFSNQEKKKHLRGLSRIFPINGGEGQPSLQSTRLTCFVGSSTLAYYTERFLKGSAMVSCMYVLLSFSVEPACLSTAAGSSLERLNLSRDGGNALLALAHLANSLLYAMLAVLSRVLFLRLDMDRGEVLTVPIERARSHLRSPGFWFDMLAIVGTIAELVHFGQAPCGEVPSAAQWVMLLQLGKVWRWLLSEAPPSLVGDIFITGVCSLFISLASAAHVMACLLLALGNHEVAWDGPSWIHELQLRNEDGGCPAFYAEAIYFAALSLTSVGYGDLLVTPLERAVNAFFLLLAQLFTAKICADLTWLVSTHNIWEAQHQAERAQTWAALQNMHVPKVLVRRVLAFQNYMATVHREDLGQAVFSGLSENLIKELRLCAYRKLVVQAPFLREQSKDVIARIVGALRDAVYLPADFILCPGQRGRELYFMRRGEAALFVDPEPPCWGETQEIVSYKEGTYFGELGMLTGRPRSAWIMAKSYVVCSVLGNESLESLGYEFPGAFTTLVQSMIQTFKLKASLNWEAVSTRLADRFSFESIEDAFTWFVDQGGDIHDDDELSAKAFEESMRRLKVPELDRKILWAEMDQDHSGFVSKEEFMTKLQIQSAMSAKISRRRHTELGQRGSLGSLQTFVEQNGTEDPDVDMTTCSNIVNERLQETLKELENCQKKLAESQSQVVNLTAKLSEKHIPAWTSEPA